MHCPRPRTLLDTSTSFRPGAGSPNWADKLLTQHVYALAGEIGKCIPDMDGYLRTSEELILHPRSLPEEALEIWASVPGRPLDWCHRSVETRDRRPRAERIFGRPAASPAEWLDALLAVATPAASVGALQILAILEDGGLNRRTAAVLTSAGSWVPADLQNLFIVDGTPEIEGAHVVSADVVSSPEGRAALVKLGVRTLDALGEIDTALSKSLRLWDEDDWGRFWPLTRRVTVDDCLNLLVTRGVANEIKAKMRTGDYRRLLASLLPGDIVGRDEEVVTVDLEFHRADLELLVGLGAVAAPHGGTTVPRESWFPEYLEKQRSTYLRDLPSGGPRPMRDYLTFDQSEAVGPLGALPALSPPAASRFTAAALAQPGARQPWTMHHETQTQYPRKEMEGPTIWMLRTHGAIETSLGPRMCSGAFGSSLTRYRAWLPVADLGGEACELLGIEDDPAKVPVSAWQDALKLTYERSGDDLGALFAAAARCGVASPPTITVVGRSEPVDPSVVTVVLRSDPARFVLENRGDPFVDVVEPLDVEVLTERWGLRRPDPATEVEVAVADEEEPVNAAAVFPLLPLYAGGRGRLIGHCPGFRRRTPDPRSRGDNDPVGPKPLGRASPDGHR